MPVSRDPHAVGPLHLLTLGRAVLVDATGTPLVAQPRRVALLAIVAAAGDRGIRRDKLVAYLSPERTTDAARHSLHQLLYYVRRQAGAAIFLGTDPLRINAGLLTHDATSFDAAFEAGAFDEAVRQYRGPFLDGFHLSDASEFDEWASAERDRLATRHRSGLLALARAARERGDSDAAATWSHTLSVADPLSVPAVLEEMRALAASHDRAGALRIAEELQRRLQDELGASPDAEVAALAAAIRNAGPSHIAPGVDPPANPVTIADVRDDAAGEHRAVAVAWVEPPGNLSPHPPASGSRRSRDASSKGWRWQGVLGVLVAMTGVAIARLASPASARVAADARVLAILPVENHAGDSVAFLAQGVEDAVHTALRRMPALRIVPASVMKQYPDAARGERPTAQLVGAGMLLRSRLVQDQDTLRWVAEFIDRHGAPIRGGRFTLSAATIATLMDDVVDTVAIAMQLSRGNIAFSGPTDGEARLLVMRADHFMLNRDPQGMRRAQLLLGEAIERDPLYADAYSRLGFVYGFLGMSGDIPVSEAFELADAAARRALSIDPSQTMAMANLAHEQNVRFWRWDAGEAGLRRALTLEPWRASTWNMLGTSLRMRGRFDEAREAFEQARSLDPLARHYTYQIGHAFHCAGELDSALVWLQRALVISPGYATAHELIADGFARRGLPDSAIAHYRVMATLTRDSSATRLLHDARGEQGLQRFLRAWARRLLQQAASDGDRHRSEVTLATLQAMAGDTTRALDLLERAARVHDPTLPAIACVSAFTRLRSAPRFDALMRTMNLTASSYGSR